eukprot:SAG25_NODE_634_length_6297_cov_3.877541_4_plen_70_part_00
MSVRSCFGQKGRFPASAKKAESIRESAKKAESIRESAKKADSLAGVPVSHRIWLAGPDLRIWLAGPDPV